MREKLAMFALLGLVLVTGFVLEGGRASAGGGDTNTINGLQRRECSKWVSPCTFTAGEAVFGAHITIDGVQDDNCFVTRAPKDGTVSDGTVNFWLPEPLRAGFGACSFQPRPSSGTVNGLPKRSCQTSSPCRFNAGEAVLGRLIILDDLKRVCVGGDCFVLRAPTGGWVFSGVVNPLQLEIGGRNLLNFP